MKLSQQSKDAIQSSLDNATADSRTGIPGIAFAAIDGSGNYLTTNVSGVQGASSKEPMILDTVLWIASLTKLITVIACMQMVEQGQLSLDDSKQVLDLIPELKDVKVLDEQMNLVGRKDDFTLRMLLTHMAGYSYAFFSERLRDFGVFPDHTVESYFKQPLIHQPGATFSYGVNIDFVGLLVERTSGLKLNAYVQRNIFNPLGIKDISFVPPKEMRDRLARQHYRGADGVLQEGDHLYSFALKDDDSVFHSGGGGCFGSVEEYLKLLAMLLSNGKSPTTGAQVLRPETVDMMFENQLHDLPDFGRTPIQTKIPMLTNTIDDLYPQEGNPPQGWSFGGFLTLKPAATGRGNHTLWWAGLANLYWWCDRERGVAGLIGSQILPFWDEKVLHQWHTCEKAVYDGLEKS
ncbi:beta-lactamase/transpeptidase-like protein [Cryomyces antarcticus]